MSNVLKIIAVILIILGIWMTYMGFIIPAKNSFKEEFPIWYHLGNTTPIIIGISVLISSNKAAKKK